MIEISTKFTVRAGFLEYCLILEDADKSIRKIEGSSSMPDDLRSTSERQLDIKNFNYKEIGYIFAKTEAQFYQLLSNVVLKMRPAFNEETKRSPEERETANHSRSIISQLMKEMDNKQRNTKPTSKVLQAFGALALGNKSKPPAH